MGVAGGRELSLQASNELLVSVHRVCLCRGPRWQGGVCGRLVRSAIFREIDFSRYFQHADTIDKLFGLIERALEEDADVVSVEYDGEYGFPTDISIDWYREGYDDEVWCVVREFEVLE